MFKRKRAILYVRVSTDEQNNGYSPADQKARLIKYCESNGIEIVAIYHEDASGKTFKRPEWLKIVEYLKQNRGSIDYLLFIKWDRFSRNQAKAHASIELLNRYGVEPQAIEQPLNLEIPEQKIMLAIYLAAPEVDNDRRALNIFHGYRRGKKEGQWLGACLKGYTYQKDERGKAFIIPEGGKNQQYVTEAFNSFATGNYIIEDLRRRMNRAYKMSVSRNSFWMLLHNKGYIGKVYVPAFKDEPAEWVTGRHESLVDEHTFYTVQDIMDGRKKKRPSKNKTQRDEFPLRGFLQCPQCGKNMTASVSRGTGGLFHYYHCSKGCKERQKAPILNDQFKGLLTALKLNGKSNNLYRTALEHILHGDNKHNKTELAEANKAIEKHTQRLKNLGVLMMDGEISPEDYRQMKIDTTEEVQKLKAKVEYLNENTEDYTAQIDFFMQLFANLDVYYDTANIEVKQQIISSIFPEKLVFEQNKYRTDAVNDIIAELCANSEPSKGAKKGKHAFLDVLSRGVDPEGFEPSSKQGIHKLSTCLKCI